MRIILTFTAIALFSGCATQPTTPADAEDVPADRIQWSGHDEGGSVLVIRDGGFTGSACPHQFLVDGRPTVLIRAGERFRFRLEPGEYIFGVESTGMCGGGGSSIRAPVRADKPNHYRISVTQGMDNRIQPYRFRSD